MLCFILDFIQCLKKTKKKKQQKPSVSNQRLTFSEKTHRTLEREEHQTSKRVEHFC